MKSALARIPAVLVALGLLSSIGYLSGSDALRGAGLLTQASPLPLVFSAFRGIETFALDFTAELEMRDGTKRSFPITPALYSKFRAPYNLRNVYGAVISYGPAFREPRELALVDSVLRHGFCGSGPLARDFEVTGEIASVAIHAESRTAGKPGHYVMRADCAQGGVR